MKTLTCDLDGVVVGGLYLPEWDRKPEIYAALPPIPQAKESLWHLNSTHHIYYLSSRSFLGSGLTSCEWLKKNGFPLGRGVITGIASEHKPFVSRALGANLHIDDNPSVIQQLYWSSGPRGVLFVGREEEGWWEGTRAYIESGRPYFHEWGELVSWLTKQ